VPYLCTNNTCYTYDVCYHKVDVDIVNLALDVDVHRARVALFGDRRLTIITGPTHALIRSRFRIMKDFLPRSFVIVHCIGCPYRYPLSILRRYNTQASPHLCMYHVTCLFEFLELWPPTPVSSSRFQPRDWLTSTHVAAKVGHITSPPEHLLTVNQCHWKAPPRDRFPYYFSAGSLRAACAPISGFDVFTGATVCARRHPAQGSSFSAC
jgi:hypothetical protein